MGKVLVVDIDDTTRDLCFSALEDVGHRVVCLDSYEEAWEIGVQEDFDLAIIGLGKDETKSIDLFKRCRRHDPTIAGILTYEEVGLQSITEAMNCGFSRICKKPLTQDIIIEAVGNSLDIASLREEVTRMKTLLPLYKLGKSFLAAETEQAIYDKLIDAVCHEIGVPKVSVMMYDEKSKSLRVVAFRGLQAKFVENLELKPGERIAGKVFTANRPVILNRGNESGPYIDLLRRQELAAAICFPIASKGKTLGVLNVSETRGGTSFSEADIEMISIISDQAMMALENIRSMREREEHSRIQTLMAQYVSPEVSTLLAQSSRESMENGMVQDLTVLFADIRNFTLLVQQLPPEQTRNFLNAFFEKFATSVFSQKGMLDKFMGDAALAVFGAPIKLENASQNAVQAAQSIRTDFIQLQNLWCRKNLAFEKIGLGIGISRGPIFLGNVGFTKRLDYTVIGTDVNIAQRLASQSLSGQMFITESVREKLPVDFPVESEKRLFLRGIENEVKVFLI